jgi:hypothetical protein
MLIFNNSTDNQFRVALNDILPSSYVSLTVNILGNSPHTGTATVSGSTVFYTPATGKSADTLRYRIHCGNAEYADTATIYVKIMDKVDNIGDAECFVEPPSTAFSFNKLAESPSSYSINNYNIPLVGDIDNDGFTEIIVSGTSESGVSTTKLYIFEFKNGQILHQQTLTTPYFNNVANPYSIAKVDGNDYAAIFLCTDNTKNSATSNKLKLIKYTYNGTAYSEQTRVTYSSLANKEMAQPMITDFNGDGIPEVVTYDKVFNARTMTLLANGDLLSDNTMGFGFGGHYNNNYTSESSSMMAIADMDDDGIPEVIGGNCVYKVNITNPSGTIGNSFTLWSQCDKRGPNEEAHSEAVDGATAVADMDGDGLLDVIVSVTPVKRGASSGGALYIWNPRTKKVMHTDIHISFPGAGSTFSPSVAFIGDIDNDKQPEICLTAVNNMYAFEYNSATKRLTQKWNDPTTDSSGATTMSMFDFNQDGYNELVYRDITHLRILNGTDGFNLINPISCGSSTANEYPVVANINDDGAAEIIVTGGTRVWVYASNPVGLWASARKVWNQFAYNAVNINEDLTVPTVQLNPATVFPGPDGQLGTSDDIRPYNGYLQQQTTLSKTGIPYWEASDYAIEGVPSAIYYETGDSLVISFCVSNYGDVQGTPPFYVSVYQNARQSGNAVVTKSFSNIPAPGLTVCDYSIRIENVKTTVSINSLHLWLNDSGAGTSVNSECDYTNGVVVYDVTGTVNAQNDYASMFQCEEITIPILANDEYSGTTFNILNTPKYGTAVQTGGKLKYTHNSSGTSGLSCEQTGNRIDTIRYGIQSIISSAVEADVIVKIYSLPEMLLENACSANPKIVLNSSYEGFTYKWEYSPDGASGWQVVQENSGSTELNITQEGFYRVTVSYDNGKTHQLKKGLEVVADRKTLLPGGIVWYEMSFNTVDITWQ